MNAEHGHPPTPGRAPGPNRYSPEGERRRQEIFGLLRSAMTRRRRRRAAARAGAVGAIPLLALGAAAWLLARPASPAPAPMRDSIARADGADGSAKAAAEALTERPFAQFAFVRTDPRRVQGLLVRDEPDSLVSSIGDDELLAALARSGNNCGIVRSGGRALVTDNDRGGELRTVSLDGASTEKSPGALPGGGAI